MFILSGLVVGLLAGSALGGRLEALATVRFRFGALALVALGVQLALFSPIADGLPDEVARLIYVLSTGLVGIVVLANLRLTGVPLIALGAGLNLLAIAANGGAMPASPEALATAGLGVGGNTNSVVVAKPALAPLTDIFALPAGLPLANVFSLGDVLIGVGLAIAVAAAMRARARPA